MNYPIIHFFPGDKNIYAQGEGAELASISLLHTFKGSIILDSGGKRFLAKNAIKIGWAHFFGYHPLMKGRTAKIAYEFSKVDHMSLVQYKQLIVEWLLNGVGSKFWYSASEIPLLIGKVNDSSDYKSVVECFMNDIV